MVEQLETLDKVLRAFGKYLRAKAKSKFQAEGPGWQELAASTRKRLESTGTGRLTERGKVRQTARIKALASKLSNDGARNAELLSKLRSVTRSSGGGNLGQLIRASSAKAKQQKELLNLAAEIHRAQAKAAAGKKFNRQRRAITKHKLLGRLGTSIKASAKKNRLVVFSVVEWSEIHNDGGNTAKGARIPARTFLELDDEDLKVLEQMIADHVNGAGAG